MLSISGDGLPSASALPPPAHPSLLSSVGEALGSDISGLTKVKGKPFLWGADVNGTYRQFLRGDLCWGSGPERFGSAPWDWVTPVSSPHWLAPPQPVAPARCPAPASSAPRETLWMWAAVADCPGWVLTVCVPLKRRSHWSARKRCCPH